MYGLDIFGAFLNAEIGETVYLQLPKRLRMYNAQGEEHVWALKKSIYGLNRAPKAFYDTLCAHLIANGYNRFPLDPLPSSSSLSTSTTSPSQPRTKL